MSETDAEHFERGFKAGGVLVTVNAGPRTAEAVAIVQRHGADLGKHGKIEAEMQSRARTAVRPTPRATLIRSGAPRFSRRTEGAHDEEMLQRLLL